MLLDRQQVGQKLARVEVIGQRVDDRHPGSRGHLFETRLRVRAPDDRCHLPLEHARGVGRVSLPPSWLFAVEMMSGEPPRSAMPTANETRVRVEDLSKMTATVWGPARGLRPSGLS